MTTNQPDRLDRIETLLAETAQLTRSNAIAIQALTEDLVTFKLTVEEDIENAREEREELRQATIGVAKKAFVVRRRQTNDTTEAQCY